MNIKKILNDVLTGIAVILLCGVLYFVRDLRDFMKFKQPHRDDVQEKSIENIKNRVDADRAYYKENFKAINNRQDDHDDNMQQILLHFEKINYKLKELNDKQLTANK